MDWTRCARDVAPPSETADTPAATRKAPTPAALADAEPTAPTDTFPERDAAQMADLDCDGIAYSVMITGSDALFTLFVFREVEAAAPIMTVPVGSFQTAVCKRSVSLVLESPRSGTDPSEFGELPGVRPSETCKGIALDGNARGVLHIF